MKPIAYIIEFQRRRKGSPWKRAAWIAPKFCAPGLDALELARDSRDFANQYYRQERFRVRALLSGKVTP